MRQRRTVKPKYAIVVDGETEFWYNTKQNKDIYLQLSSRLPIAIANAKKLKEFDFDNPNSGISQMHFLLENIGIKH